MSETLQAYLTYLVKYLKRYATPFSGYILGLSGGLDSAVAALIAKQAVGSDLLNVIIAIDSDPQDMHDAREFAEIHNLNVIELDLSAQYHSLIELLEREGPLTELAKINTKVRLRMVTLYALGQTRNKLVLGTDNLAELYTGYFTKYGDGGVDLFLLSSLTKGEVRTAGRMLGVTEAILNKKPSAGLYNGQTDEQELRITYEQLDNYLLGKEVTPSVRQRALHLHKVSAHKRNKITRPRAYKRNDNA